jgi:hypothetical protein
LLELPLIAEVCKRYTTFVKDGLGLAALTIYPTTKTPLNPIS